MKKLILTAEHQGVLVATVKVTLVNFDIGQR